MVTSGDDGTARIWEPLTGKELMVFKASGAVAAVAFSPDGKYVVGASFDGTVPLWDVVTGKEVRHFSGHPGGVYDVAFSPDGKFVLSGGVDKTARLWDVQTGQEVRRFTGHTDSLRNVTFSPDGKYILTASQDSTARLWLTNLNETIRTVCSLLTRDFTSEERVQFTQGMWLGIAALMLIPILMVMLSLILPQPVNRWVNIIAASFFFLFNLVGLPTYPSTYDKFLIAVGLVFNVLTVWYAWNWS